MEPAAFAYAERHDNIEAIYKKLEERRDTADVTELLKELHRIVNEAIRAAAPGDDQKDSKLFDLSQIDLEKLRDEFAKKVKRKATALQDIRQIVEEKLAQMLAQQSAADGLLQEVFRDHRRLQPREGPRDDRGDVRASWSTSSRAWTPKQRRAAEEGLSEEELALFDLLQKDDLSKADRETREAGEPESAGIDSASSSRRCERWTEKEQTQAEVEVFILDHLFPSAADAAIHRRREAGGGQARLPARLAAEREQGHTGNAFEPLKSSFGASKYRTACRIVESIKDTRFITMLRSDR